MDALQDSVIFAKGELAAGEHFNGNVWLKRLIPAESPWNCPLGNVTFEPGARNSWHRHPGGQILLVTGGKGWYQEDGKTAQSLCAGDVVMIPAHVKHWHGAQQNSWFTHLYIVANPSLGPCEWLEPVSDAQYNALAN